MTKEMTRRGALTGLAASYVVASASRAALAAPENVGEYAGALKSLPGGCIVLSSDGEHVLVYFCDGTPAHRPTVSHWMRGEIVKGSVRIAGGGFTLVAELQKHGRRATGTLTLANGTTSPFTAHNHWPHGTPWSVYRSEAQIGGVPYVGGWIAAPDGHADIRPSSSFYPVSWSPPSPVDALARPVADFDIEDEVALEDYPRTGGGIINQQTGTVLPYVAPNLATMTAEVPGLGEFNLHRCITTKCS